MRSGRSPRGQAPDESAALPVSTEEADGLRPGGMSRRSFTGKIALAVPAALVAGGIAGPLVGEGSASAESWKLEGNEATERHMLGTKGANALRFGTADAERMRLDDRGRLGVGTSRPQARVHVATDGESALRTSAKGGIGIENEGVERTGARLRGTATGLESVGGDVGVYGSCEPEGQYGLFGYASGRGGRAVGAGAHDEHSVGLHVGVAGRDSHGVFSETAAEGSTGVYALAHGRESTAVYGTATAHDSAGVYADGSTAYKTTHALWAEGRSHVNGALTHSGSGFQIDHPLRPSTHVLQHAAVESSEMKNVYDGVVILDQRGRAVVRLPGWFDAVNRDVRYQLTAIGAAAPELHVAAEVAGGRFEIGGGRPGLKVSWQLTGIRKDAWAEAHPVKVVQPKPVRKIGAYLHPELHSGDRSFKPRPEAPEAKV
jgi:hypothetical protein